MAAGGRHVVDPRAQAITSADARSAAAIAINVDLVQDDIDHAMAGHDVSFAASATAVARN